MKIVRDPRSADQRHLDADDWIPITDRYLPDSPEPPPWTDAEIEDYAKQSGQE